MPCFIFKRMKKTSATGHIRSSQNINKREQDGLKLPWLCFECEQLFSKYEKYFSEKIFHPIHEQQKEITYNNMLSQFAASVAWRVLMYFIEINAIEHINLQDKEATEKRWHNYLLNQNKHPGTHELHFYNLLGQISADVETPNNISRYLSRATDLNVFQNQHASFVYIKSQNFLIIGYIKLPQNSRTFRKSRICISRGQIAQGLNRLPESIWELIKERAKVTKSYQNSLSESEQLKIYKSYRKNLERASNSETIKALTKDVQVFGINSVFDNGEEE
jgi:hypothetical protein